MSENSQETSQAPSQSTTSKHITADEIKDRIDRRVGFSLDELSEKNLREAECWEKVCVIPHVSNDRFSYLGDMLVQAVSKKTTGDLGFVMSQLTQALTYMLNSASWREGELHDFDMDELQRKLTRFVKPVCD